MKINIEIKKRSILKEFFHKLHSKSEDVLFFIVQKMPEKFTPHWLMQWLERYTTKRIAELKQSIIKDRWKSMELDKAVDIVSKQQQDIEKAPSKE